MVDAGDAVNVGRSLLVGIALDQLRLRSRPLVFGLGLLAVVAFVAAIAFDGALRAISVAAFLLLAFSLVVALLARFVAGRILRRIAPPTEMKDHREAIDDAIDQLALPTGPISGLRFAWGLRDGIDDELANADDVITTLRERLNV